MFTDLQLDKEVNLKNWGKENPSEFYKLCAKLIPAAVDVGLTIKKLGKDLEDEQYKD